MLINVFVLVTFFLKFCPLESCCCMKISAYIYITFSRKNPAVLVARINMENLKIQVCVDKCRHLPNLFSFKDVSVFTSL